MNAAEAIRQFEEHLSDSLSNGSFVRLVLSHPAPGASPLRRVLGRLVTLRGAPVLSLTLQESRQDTTRNLPLAEVPAWITPQLADVFRSALLETTARDWQLALPADRPPRLVAHRARHPQTPARTHDVPKTSALDASARDWMEALGLIDARGCPTPRRADKHLQVQRYADILSHLIRDLDLEPGAPWRVVDMGCGRGALTFATWQLLRRQARLDVRVLGVDARADLVSQAASIAGQLQLDGLAFQVGAIESLQLSDIDVLVALHACNTATDAALARGIRLGAQLILVAPCCHQELRPQLGLPEPIAPILRHGIMAERMAEWLTDGLRALHLEAAGYRVRLIEFVPAEHTPKNLLLAGTRTRCPNPTDAVRIRAQIASIKAFFGIDHHALDSLLGS